MGQPAHPQGTRVNSIQLADISLAWWGSERGFFFQPYLVSLLFKFIRQWVTAGLVLPHQTIWVGGGTLQFLKLRSRRTIFPARLPFPDLGWVNNVPNSLRKASSRRPQERFAEAVVIRYFRQLPPTLVLRDSVEDLIRPALTLRRPRYAFTF